jgi:hypothetical protein
MESAPVQRSWRARLSSLARVLVLLALVTSALLVLGLLVGESTRPTFVLLHLPRHPLVAVAAFALVVSLVLRRRRLVIGSSSRWRG